VSQFFHIHPENPQGRLIARAVEIVRAGGLIIYPTDSAYAIGCHLDDKNALERVRTIRRLDKHHNFTLVCRNLSDVGVYARLDNTAYRYLKAHTPGAYTFILQATAEVPRRLLHEKRRTIGLRVPDHPVTQALLEALGEPLMSCTLILPGETLPMTDPEEIRDRLEHQVELVIDSGLCGQEPTTVIDLQEGYPRLLRQGAGHWTE
jgi:tRNA threonylcarbamoyl adenosine modification protein (Sua5/YciO/YrdC/YwlC family)